jgi:hypothetical protein
MHHDSTDNATEQQGHASAIFTRTADMSGAKTSAGLTQFMTPKEIQDALKCSRASAYRHVRRAAGKAGRGLLRVAFEDWERYPRNHVGSDPRSRTHCRTRFLRRHRSLSCGKFDNRKLRLLPRKVRR